MSVKRTVKMRVSSFLIFLYSNPIPAAGGRVERNVVAGESGEHIAAFSGGYTSTGGGGGYDRSSVAGSGGCNGSGGGRVMAAAVRITRIMKSPSRV